MSRKPTEYWTYIKTEELLSLQCGIANDDSSLSNDEVLFITVHQIDELWFKLILRELVSVRDLFAQTVVPEQSLASAVRGIRRMETVLRHTAQHFEVMETMTTRDYLEFRDKLSPASGFQSAQLREIEILLGLEDAERVPLGGMGGEGYMRALRGADGSESSASRRVTHRHADHPRFKAAFFEWLYRTPIQGSVPSDANDESVVRQFIDDYVTAHADVTQGAAQIAMDVAFTEADKERLRLRYQKEVDGVRAFLNATDVAQEDLRPRVSRLRAALVFIEGYRELPLLAWPREVIDAIIAFEQAFVVFRQRHARMVERVIGRRIGTGGSSGVDYLDQTALKYRVFHDVWAVRTILIRRDRLPKLESPSFYGFVRG